MSRGEMHTGVAVVVRAAPWAGNMLQALDHLLLGKHPNMLRLGEAMKRLQNGPPVAGYERLLEEVGCPASEARLIARAIHVCGDALKDEHDADRALAKAIRAVASATRKRNLTIARRAGSLRDLLKQASAAVALHRVCDAAGRSHVAFELADVARRAAAKDPAACAVLASEAARLLPFVAESRGRRLGAATAKHELVLEYFHQVGKPRRFTRNPYCDDGFTDAATQATRIAVGDPGFDPRPASRRLQRRLRTSL